jgi:hypothetical protein
MAIGVAVQLAASPAPTDMGDGRMRGGDGHPGAGGEPRRHRRPPWEGAHRRTAPVEIHARSRGSSTCRPHRGSSTPGVGERCHGRAVPVEIHPPRTVGNLHALYLAWKLGDGRGVAGELHTRPRGGPPAVPVVGSHPLPRRTGALSWVAGERYAASPSGEVVRGLAKSEFHAVARV